MSDISLSKAVRTNLLSLQSTAEMMNKTQERLSTGNKVNSALDNPTSFFTASALNSRASDINTLMDSVSNGVQTLKAADTGITSLQKLVESAKATARQALQSPNAYTSKASLASASGGLQAADLTGIIAGTGVNASTGAGTVAVDTTNSASANKVATEVTDAMAADTAATVTGSTVNAAAATTTTDINDTTAFAAGNRFAAGDSITFKGSSGSFTLNVTDGTSGAQDANNIRATDDIATLQSKLQAGLRQATGDTGATVTYNDAAAAGNDNWTIALTDTTKDVTIGGNSAKLGITAGTIEPAFGDADMQALVAAGRSLTIAVGDNASKTLYIGNGEGKINNRRDLLEQLNTVQGLSTTLNANNSITLKSADASDLRSAIKINVDDAGVLSAIGIGTVASATDTNGKVAVSGTSATISATNLLDQVSGLSGDKLTIGVGENEKTFTFGTGKDEIATYEELEAAVGSMGAILSKDAGNRLSISTSDANVAKSLKVTGDATTTLGLNDGTYSGSGESLSGKQLNISTGSGLDAKTTSITFGSAAGQVKSLDDLNTRLKAEGFDIEATVDDDGKLSLNTTNAAARETFTVSGSAAVQAFGAASAFSEVASTDPVFGGTGDATRRGLVNDFNNLLGQINTLAQDSSYNGVNLLNGDDLSLVFNETGSSKLDITGVSFDASGLGLQTLAADGSDFLDSNSINEMITKLDSASSSLRSQAAKFGSNLSVVQTRQDFSKKMINTLETGAANLTLADMNAEAANLLALQTRQSLSQSSLSMASQADQSVLQLLR